MENKKEEHKFEDELDVSVYLDADSYDNTEGTAEDAVPSVDSARDNNETQEVNSEDEISTLDEPIADREKADEPGNKQGEEAPAVKKKGKLSAWWHKRNKWQRALIIICAVLVVVVLAAGIFVWSKLALIDTDGEDDFSGTSFEDDIDVSDMDGITDASSLTDFLVKWANNKGEKMHSKYVKNVLLIGLRDGLADSMILISLNEKEDKINMVSFYRDSYTYIQPEGKKAQFGKMNAAYAKGGAKCLIKTIEDDYKIEIDDYVVVDTNSFVKVVDALGGVNVNVTTKEANYLNATWREWTFTGNKVSFSSGNNLLNGEKALMFCRVRKLDSDIGRTERQRRVITAIMNKFKNAGVGELNKAINALLPNVKTSMSKSEILSFAADAVADNWFSYPITQTPMPTTETARGGYVGDQWVWIVDYEGAAFQLQNLLYGKSNIKLEDGRLSVLNLKPTATGNAGSTAAPTNPPKSTEVPSNPEDTTAPTEPESTDPAVSEPLSEAPSEEITEPGGVEENLRNFSDSLRNIAEYIGSK